MSVFITYTLQEELERKVLKKGANLPLAVQVVPFDGIGGVETAARSTPDAVQSHYRFQKFYLFTVQPVACDALTKKNSPSRRVLDHPRVYWRALQHLLYLRPELVISSLWRSCIVAIALKLLRPSTKLVTFLHFAADVHLADGVINRIAMLLSTEVWADSQATLDARVPLLLKNRTRVISFMIERRALPTLRTPSSRFVFWGRLHKQKDITRALRFFSQIQARKADAEFLLIGPDDGELGELENQVIRLGLGASVRFTGGMERAAIFELAQNYSFYLQTSQLEGMAVSVVEAMQLGLVPVVTPVGEIARYCVNDQNAVLVLDDEASAECVLALIDNVKEYQRIANSAVQTWQAKTTYQEDVMMACGELLAGPQL